jgi:hypothetical protein
MKTQNRFSNFFVCKAAVVGAVKSVAWLITGLILAMPVSAAVFTVNSTADAATGVPGNCVADVPSPSPGTCRLRDAIAAAAASGDVIEFNVPAGSSIEVEPQLVVNNSLTIDGSGSPGLTIARGGSPNHRVFSVGAGATVAFSDFTISGGNGTGGPGESGAGINNSGDLTLTRVTLRENHCVGNNNGGGIYNTGTLTLINSTVGGTNESGNDGGGIYNTGTLTLIGSTVSDNFATHDGGGIYNAGTLKLVNSTLANNRDNDIGGGIYNASTGTLELINVTVADNTGGGNIHNAASQSNFQATNTIVQSCSGTAGTDNGGNLDGGTGCGFTSSSSVSGVPIGLGPLQDNGGPTLTMLPNPTSPAVGLGLIGTCAGSDVNGVDQRGAIRAVSPFACTSGAVEYLYLLTVDVLSPGGGSVSDDFMPHFINVCTYTGGVCSAGYATGTDVVLTATPDTGYAFVKWGGDCAAFGDSFMATVTMTQPRNCTAEFSIGHTLTVTVVGNGSVTDDLTFPRINVCTETDSPCSADYATDTDVTLEATADVGHIFVGWSGDCSGTLTTATVTMSQNRSCTATFAVAKTLDVTVTGSGTGTVTDNYSRIACASGSSTDCSAEYAINTNVTLTATADTGSIFVGWGGDCAAAGEAITADVVMSDDRACTAKFERAFELNVTVTRVNSTTATGTVNDNYSPHRINDCSIGTGTCSAEYADGDTVTLTASAASGSIFVGWSGDCTGTLLTATVTMTQARNCTATFSDAFVLTVNVVGEGSVSDNFTPARIDTCTETDSPCTAEYATGNSVTLTATADPGNIFVGWSGDCTGTALTATVTMTQARSCTATFEPAFTLTVNVVGEGSISDNFTPARIDTCTETDSPCTAEYATGNSVTLKATPVMYWVLDRWTGNNPACNNATTETITVTMDDNYTCTATFIETMDRTITVTKEVDDQAGDYVDGEFEITVTCNNVIVDTLYLADGDSDTLMVQKGDICTVTEAEPGASVIGNDNTNFAAISPSEFTVNGNQEVLVTNRIESGTVAKATVNATKVLSGDPADIAAGHDPDTVFYILVACGPTPASLRPIFLELKAGESGTVEGEVGDICVIDEPVYTPARPGYQYVWGIWPMETSLHFAGEIVEVTVDNKVIPYDPRGFHAVTLRNEVSGSTAYDPAGRFVLTLNCGPYYTWTTGPMRVGDKAGYSVPDGISCETSVVSRPNPSSGYAWRGETYSLGKTFVTKNVDEDGVVTHSLQRRDIDAPIPTLDPKALLLLIGLLTVLMFWQRRQARR